MIFDKNTTFKYKNKKLIIKNVKKKDITKQYVKATKSKFIWYPTSTIFNQQKYLNKINISKNKILLGLFDGEQLLYTSNVLLKRKCAYIGILKITKTKHKLGPLYLKKITIYLNKYFQIKKIIGRIDKNNLTSQYTFNKANFIKTNSKNYYIFTYKYD